MRFEEWEEKAFNYLTDLYNNFYNELSLKGKECFRIDAKKIFSKNVKDLTREEENKIYEY